MMNTTWITISGCAGLVCAGLATGVAGAEWKVGEADGRLEARRGDTLVMAWQRAPLAKPTGGEKFAGSAFFHPLRTPAGFEWTSAQPKDHLHHFGLWWPWKFIEVDGKRYNVWEIQEGQGAHRAGEVKQLDAGPDKLKWEFKNTVTVRPQGGDSRTVIAETATVTLAMHGEDAIALDISLDQQATGSPVTIVEYRYSGFSWRGPLSWNKDNSKMFTSEGLGRDDANGKPARWVVVTGTTPKGSASVLLMSGAAADTPERLAGWGRTGGDGNPFGKFKPVSPPRLPLDAAHPQVSKRRYRVIAADRTMDATAAEAEWRAWLGR